MKDTDFEDQLDHDEHRIRKSISFWRIFWPVVIGLGVVGFVFSRQINTEDLARLQLTRHTLFWLFVAVVLLIIRHLAYAWRLRILSEGMFSWWKSIELVFIWEFSSAVSPTSFGGSFVALYVLTKEKLKIARTTAIVIYTAIADGFFIVLVLPLMYLLYGDRIVYPPDDILNGAQQRTLILLFVYLLMTGYTLFLWYGLFVKPEKLRGFLRFLGDLPVLRRWESSFDQLGVELMESSIELKYQPRSFHTHAFLATCIAWALRFLVLNVTVIALIENTPMDLYHQLILFGRSINIFVSVAFTPTPGAAGFAELFFGPFLHDFVPSGVALLVASVWRLLTYYSYLFIGTFVVSNWITRIVASRRKAMSAD